MAAKSITYNSFDLQDSNFRTSNIVYRDLPSKQIDLEPWARRDGFRFVNAFYSQKEISIVGTLTRDTEANLKTSLDSMKESLYINEANLDIDDGGTTTRWVCSVQSIEIPEEHYHITQVPYRINFLCQPLGKETSTTTDSNTITQASASPYADTINPTGSAPPLPVLMWKVSGTPSADITAISFENTTTSDTITVSGLTLDAANDYLEVDCENMTVKASYDGGAASNVDFTGVFPTFVAGSNSYETTITGGGATWSLVQTIVYYPSYL